MPPAEAPQGVIPEVPAPHVSEVWAGPAAGRSRRHQRLRLTTRGRLVLIACAAIVASLLGFALATAAQASNPGASPRPAGGAVSQIVVQPGQTLWSIAVQADPSADPRLVIQQIVRTNALTGENLTAGQRLWVPRS